MSILKIEGQIFFLRIFLSVPSVLSVPVSILKIEGQIFSQNIFECPECPECPSVRSLNRGSDFFLRIFLECPKCPKCPSVHSQNRGSDCFLWIHSPKTFLEQLIFLSDYFVCLFLKGRVIVNIIISVKNCVRLLDFAYKCQDTFVPILWYAQYGRLARLWIDLQFCRQN